MLRIRKEEIVRLSVDGPATEVAGLAHWLEHRLEAQPLVRAGRLGELHLSVNLQPSIVAEVEAHMAPPDPHTKLPIVASALLGALNDRGGSAAAGAVTTLPIVQRHCEGNAHMDRVVVELEDGGYLEVTDRTLAAKAAGRFTRFTLTDKGRTWLAVEAARIAPGGVLAEDVDDLPDCTATQHQPWCRHARAQQPVDDPVHGAGAGPWPVLEAEAASVLDWLAHHPPTGHVHGWQATRIAKWQREVGSDHVNAGMNDLRRCGMLLPGPDGTYVTSGGTAWLQERSRRTRARADGSTAKEDDPHAMVRRSERYPRGWSPDDDPGARMR